MPRIQPACESKAMTTEILVCVLCRAPGVAPEAPRAGRALLEALHEAALAAELPFPVRDVQCMSGCRRACTVALQAQGKTSYFFGDLSADDESARQVLACAALHQTSLDGFMRREQRPARLREGILARLPFPGFGGAAP